MTWRPCGSSWPPSGRSWSRRRTPPVYPDPYRGGVPDDEGGIDLFFGHRVLYSTWGFEARAKNQVTDGMTQCIMTVNIMQPAASLCMKVRL